jgi:hypothetical protein
VIEGNHENHERHESLGGDECDEPLSVYPKADRSSRHGFAFYVRAFCVFRGSIKGPGMSKTSFSFKGNKLNKLLEGVKVELSNSPGSPGNQSPWWLFQVTLLRLDLWDLMDKLLQTPFGCSDWKSTAKQAQFSIGPRVIDFQK